MCLRTEIGRSIKRFHGGFVEETVGVAGRGVYNVDRKAKKLRFQTAYPARNPYAKIPSTSKHAKQIKVLGFDAYVVKIHHGGNTILVARAPALNGDVIQLITRHSGFSRVIEPTNISLGQPSGRSLYYEEYPVEYLKEVAVEILMSPRRRARTKLVVTLVAGLVVLSVASVLILTRAQQTGAEPGTLDWYAEQTEAHGADAWEFGSGIFEYVEPITWDEVLATQSLVVVEPIETRSYPNHNNTGIWSWWRFRVVEVLSQQNLSSCYTCSIPTVLPADFPPAQADQIVLEKYSGSLTHNGAWLTAVEPSFPEYVIGQRYLLILDLDPRDRSAAVRMGPLGVYKIDSSGNFACVCESVGRENPYRDELTTRYRNSLAHLRAALNGTPIPTPTPTPTPGSCQPSSLLIQRCEDNGGAWDWETCRCN